MSSPSEPTSQGHATSGDSDATFPSDPLPTDEGAAGSSVPGLVVGDATRQNIYSYPPRIQQYTPPSFQQMQDAYPPPSLSDFSNVLSDRDNNLPSVATPPIYATVNKPVHSPLLQLSNSARQRTISGSPFESSGSFDPSPGQPPAPQGDSSGTLALRVRHLENLCGKLSREKSDMEEDFGRQRKSFMNQMANCDMQVSQYKHKVEKYSREVQELSKVVLTRDEELQNVTIAAGITEATIREQFDADRVKYEEEIASMRKIVSGMWVCS